MGRQQRRKKVAQLNPDGTPKVKVMLAGRGGQKKAGKKAKKMKPGSAEDWMNLEPLVCPVCKHLFRVGKRSTRKKLFIRHLGHREKDPAHVKYCEENAPIEVAASKLADALNHDQGKVLGLLMSESSLVDDLVHVVKLDSGKDGMDTGAPPAATLAAAAAVADVTIAPMATDQIE
eukprot:gene10325-25506_t